MLKTYLSTANAAEIFIIGDTAQIKAIYKSLIRAHKRGRSTYTPKYTVPARFSDKKSVYGIQIGEAVMDSKPTTFKMGKKIYTYIEVMDVLPTVQVLNSDTCLYLLLEKQIQELPIPEILWGQGEPDNLRNESESED